MIRFSGVSFSFGQSSSLSTSDRFNGHDFGSGTTMGFSLDLNRKVNWFGKEFSPSVGFNYSTLEHSGHDDLALTSLLVNLSTSLKSLPLSVNLGLGYTHHSISNHTGSMIVDLAYKLPINNADLSLVIRYHNITDINKDYELDFGRNSAMGLFVQYGKSISF